MNQPKLVHDLLEFKGNGKPVLSVYLDVDASRRTRDECRLILKELLESQNPASVRKDAARVQDFLDREYDWQGKGLALFSSVSQKLWDVMRLPFPVNNLVSISDTPYVRPLIDLAIDERLGIAIVDREHARFLVSQAGEIEEVARHWRATPRRHKQEGGSTASRLQRHVDAQIEQNLKQAASQAAETLKAEGCTRLMIGGQNEPVAQFKAFLPKSWQKKVEAEFAIGVEASPAEVLSKVNELIVAANQGREAALVERVAGAALKRGSTGTLGLAETLNALNEKRVMTLVVAEGFRSGGFQCGNCGYLSAEPLRTCPVCSHKVHAVVHAVDLAIRRAVDLDGTVVTARGPAGARLAKLGGIGALLRY